MTANVRINYRGLGELLSSPGVEREMLRRARKVRDRARATAPVGDEDDRHRGDYKNSITATSEVRRRRTRRAAGVVTAEVPYAFQVEFGTARRRKRHRTLGKALDAARD